MMKSKKNVRRLVFFRGSSDKMMQIVFSQDSKYVGKSFNVCPLEHICSSVTTAKGFGELTSASV